MKILMATLLAAMVTRGADFNARAFGAKGDGTAKEACPFRRCQNVKPKNG